MNELSKLAIGKSIKYALKNNWNRYHTLEIQEKHKGELDIVNVVDYKTWEKKAMQELLLCAEDPDTFWDLMEHLFEKTKNA